MTKPCAKRQQPTLLAVEQCASVIPVLDPSPISLKQKMLSRKITYGSPQQLFTARRPTNTATSKGVSSPSENL